MELEVATRIPLSPAAEQEDDDEGIRLEGPESPPIQVDDRMTISPIGSRIIKLLEPASGGGAVGVTDATAVGATTDNCDSSSSERERECERKRELERSAESRCWPARGRRPLKDVGGLDSASLVVARTPTATPTATATATPTAVTMATATDRELLGNNSVRVEEEDDYDDDDDDDDYNSDSAECSPPSKRHINNHRRPTRGQINSIHIRQSRLRHKRKQHWRGSTTLPTATETTTTAAATTTTTTATITATAATTTATATATKTTTTNAPSVALRVSGAQLDKLSSLIKIIRNGNYKEFSELLEGRAFKNLLNVFVDGQTALHYSLIYGRSLAWCKQLVLNGANPNLTNRAGWHPIHLAAFNGSRETMRYLIDCIAN